MTADIILSIDHRNVHCSWYNAAGNRVVLRPMADKGACVIIDREIALIGMEIRRQWNQRGWALLDKNVFLKLDKATKL